MIPYQLDLFETQEQSQLKAIEQTVLNVKVSCDKVRKKLFANNGELYKLLKDVDERLQIIERNICKSKNLDIILFEHENIAKISEKLEKAE